MDWRADVDSQGGVCGNALQAAAQVADAASVVMLLEMEVDMIAVSGKQHIALHAAVWAGSKEIGKLHVEEGGVDVEGAFCASPVKAAVLRR